jgi:sodium/potassium-transporting ATPase subunit alpha
VNKEHENGVLQSYIKGAPERVLAKCTHFLQGGTVWEITDEFKGLYDEAYSVRPSLRLTQMISLIFFLSSTWLPAVTG